MHGRCSRDTGCNMIVNGPFRVAELAPLCATRSRVVHVSQILPVNFHPFPSCTWAAQPWGPPDVACTRWVVGEATASGCPSPQVCCHLLHRHKLHGSASCSFDREANHLPPYCAPHTVFANAEVGHFQVYSQEQYEWRHSFVCTVPLSSTRRTTEFWVWENHKRHNVRGTFYSPMCHNGSCNTGWHPKSGHYFTGLGYELLVSKTSVWTAHGQYEMVQ